MITLKNINEATLQDIFDQSSNHLLKQNKKAREEYSTTCRYRTNDGLMCAVGCLISDDEYDPSIEGRGVHDLISTYEIDVHGSVSSLLSRLQEIHDCYLPEEWEEHLAALAIEKGLKFTKP